MSIGQWHVLDHAVASWDRVPSFIDREMKVPICISLSRQMHLHPTSIFTYSSAYLVYRPKSKFKCCVARTSAIYMQENHCKSK